MALRQFQPEPQYFMEEEYFSFEKEAYGRWEYACGEIRAMAGGSDDHNTIASNIIAVLHSILVPKGCRVYGPDMKIHTGDGVNTFPDAAVVCGERRYYQGRTDIITNPLLVVEVLSPATEDYDRTGKFDHYRTLPALTDYLLVAQNEPKVLLHTRCKDDWQMQEVTGLGNTIHLPSVDITLPLVDLYALIEFA